MYEIETQQINNILSNFLGEPKNEGYSSGWQDWDCPACAEEKGDFDGHHNLAVNISEGYCHCWRCGFSGKISKLIGKYGSRQDLSEYKNILSNIRTFKLYTFGENTTEDVPFEKIEITLPKDWHPFITDNGYTYKEGLEYLHKRGLTDEMIKDFNLGYVGKDGDPQNKRRVIVPSYDTYGNLTYWLGRDWTGKNKIRYSNAEGSKTEIVFNEGRINTYEPIIICEGTFDHMVLPNSIPIMGKSLTKEHAVYNYLMDRAKSDVYICLDDDAKKEAYETYRLLNQGPLKGRVKYIECKNKDASLVFQEEGKQGIVNLIRSAHYLNEFDLIMC